MWQLCVTTELSVNPEQRDSGSSPGSFGHTGVPLRPDVFALIPSSPSRWWATAWIPEHRLESALALHLPSVKTEPQAPENLNCFFASTSGLYINLITSSYTLLSTYYKGRAKQKPICNVEISFPPCTLSCWDQSYCIWSKARVGEIILTQLGGWVNCSPVNSRTVIIPPSGSCLGWEKTEVEGWGYGRDVLFSFRGRKLI